MEYLFESNEYNAGDIYCHPLNISVNTYKYLLANHNLNLKEFFMDVIKSEPGDKHDQSLDLALSKSIN